MTIQNDVPIIQKVYNFYRLFYDQIDHFPKKSREVLIKKIQKSPGQVILSSLNSEAYPPFTANRDFRIEGVVKGVISYSMGMG